MEPVRYLRLRLKDYTGDGHITFLYFGKDLNVTYSEIAMIPMSPTVKGTLVNPTPAIFDNETPVMVFRKTGDNFVHKLTELRRQFVEGYMLHDLWDRNRREYSPHMSYAPPDIGNIEVTGIETNTGELVMEFDDCEVINYTGQDVLYTYGTGKRWLLLANPKPIGIDLIVDEGEETKVGLIPVRIRGASSEIRSLPPIRAHACIWIVEPDVARVLEDLKAETDEFQKVRFVFASSGDQPVQFFEHRKRKLET